MNILTVITIVAMMALDTNANLIKEHQRTINDIHELMQDIRLKNDELRQAGNELKTYTMQRQAMLEMAAIMGRFSNYRSTVAKIKAYIPELCDEGTVDPICTECSVLAESKLKAEDEHLANANCTKKDLERLDNLIAYLNVTYKLGDDFIAEVSFNVSNCKTEENSEEGFQCINEEFHKAKTSYDDVDYKIQNAKELIRVARAQMHKFPCLEESINKFFMNANRISARARLCMKLRDTSDLK